QRSHWLFLFLLLTSQRSVGPDVTTPEALEFAKTAVDFAVSLHMPSPANIHLPSSLISAELHELCTFFRCQRLAIVPICKRVVPFRIRSWTPLFLFLLSTTFLLFAIG